MVHLHPELNFVRHKLIQSYIEAKQSMFLFFSGFNFLTDLCGFSFLFVQYIYCF